jgi:D-serine deaminase-like pyridoxal phosphate-dependent protein
VASAAAAVELAGAVAAAPRLGLRGLQFYCGGEQHIVALADRRAAIERRTAYLREVLEALAGAGHRIATVTGSGTGTFAIDASLGVFTELQVGSYVFMDREYLDCEFPEGSEAPRFESALFVDSTVISANHASHVTVDAGLKALSPDAGPAHVTGPAGGTYRFMGDEHGAVIGAAPLPQLGERVALVPGHCDPTVNLYDRYAVVDGGDVVEFWPVTGRGRSA